MKLSWPALVIGAVAADLALMVLIGPVISQSQRNPRAMDPTAAERQDDALRRLMLEVGQGRDDAAEMAIAKRKAAHEADRQFIEKFNALINELNRLGNEYHDKGTFNIKQAAKISKAWRKLHDDPGWLEKDKEKQP